VSFSENTTRQTYNAGADLSASQFRFVVLSGASVVRASAGARATGVLLNQPKQDQAATVAVSGSLPVQVGTGGLTAGAAVAVGANALAVNATAGDVVVGYARETAVVNQIATIDFVVLGSELPT